MGLTQDQQDRLDKLVTWVTLRVDEYVESSEAGSPPEIPTGDIKYELREAARKVLRALDRLRAFIPAKKLTGEQLEELSETNGTRIPLPDDFLRFISVKMDGWKRPATSFVRDTSRAYQHQVYKQRQATENKPLAALVPNVIDDPQNGESNFALDVFPKAEALDFLYYVPYLESYDMPEEFTDALVYRAAAAVLITMRRTNEAQAALQSFQAEMELLNQGAYGEQG